MLDEKKIEEAARKRLYAFRKANPDGYSSSIIDIESDCLDNFKAGAHWAVQEFLKGLWHDASEEPKTDDCLILVLDSETNEPRVLDLDELMNSEEYDDYSYSITWRFLTENENFTRWLYIEDLEPKQKGGKGCKN